MLATGAGFDGTASCGSKPQSTPNVGLWFAIQTAIAGQGVINSLIFGMQKSNWWLWVGFIQGKGKAYTGPKAERPEPRFSKLPKSSSRTSSNNNNAESKEASSLRRPVPSYPVARLATKPSNDSANTLRKPLLENDS
jgi:hypothetical protein